MEHETHAPRIGTPRWMKIALILSLAFNCLVIGVVLGAVVLTPHAGGRPSSPGGLAAPLVRALPEPDRRALRRDLRENHRSAREARVELRAARDELVSILRGDPFDPQAFSAALDIHRARGQSFVAAGQSALVARVKEMSAEDRLAYAARLEEIGARRPVPRD